MSPADLARFRAALRDLFGPERVATEPEQLLTYECDGHAMTRAAPDAVVYPETTEEVQEAVRLCVRFDVPFLPRGAGTGLSGGAIATRGGLVIETARMTEILLVDLANRVAVVQPGLVNIHLTRRTSPEGYHYAPDPSSQTACTIGGNVAENSGGPHTLRYGVTTNHVLALEMVLPSGEIVRTGSLAGPGPGYDLTGLIVGSEGTFGVVTEVTVRLMRDPEAVRTFLGVFDSVEDASETVSAIIRRGIVPAALELMDALAIDAVERHLKAGYPTDAGAVLLVELEGLERELGPLGEEVESICHAKGAREVRHAEDERTRQQLWKGRKQALGAVGKISRAYYTHDGVVPRSRLPEALRRIGEIANRHRLRVANVCHAGDGNIHPLILFDPDDADEVQRVHAAGSEILRTCVDLGGTLTGEHGIGLEKRACMEWIFSEDDLDTMRRVRHAFDPDERANPEKVFPTGASCGEIVAARRGRTGGWI